MGALVGTTAAVLGALVYLLWRARAAAARLQRRLDMSAMELERLQLGDDLCVARTYPVIG